MALESGPGRDDADEIAELVSARAELAETSDGKEAVADAGALTCWLATGDIAMWMVPPCVCGGWVVPFPEGAP